MDRCIAIYSGTFNPIHNGHIYLAKQCLKEIQPEKLLIIPSQASPWKPTEELAPYDDRFNMCSIAIGNLPNAEVVKSDETYAAHLIKDAITKYPGYKICYLLGSDAAWDISHWHQSEFIFENCFFAIMKRSGSKDLLLHPEKTGFHFQILNCEGPEISSTYIRNVLKCGDVPTGIDPMVLDYIFRKNLYVTFTDKTHITCFNKCSNSIE